MEGRWTIDVCGECGERLLGPDYACSRLHCNALCDGNSHWLGVTWPLDETRRMRSEMLDGSALLDVLPAEGRTGVRGQVVDGDVLP